MSPSTIARRDELAGGAWNPPIRVSVLYGVQWEMNRHGLRSAVAARPEPSALILVPGIEPNPGEKRWGVGINELDLRRALEVAVGRPVDYRTSVVAAYSTGINGLNQTMLHSLIDVSRTERLVTYDCLYEQSSGNTATALASAKRRAGPNLKIVAYKCTGAPGTSQGGNTLDRAGNLSVAMKNPGLIASNGIIDGFYAQFRVAYTSLILYRSLEAGIADGVVTLSAEPALDKAYTAMSAIVPKRRTLVSRAATWQYVFGSTPPPGTVLFETWASDKANRPIISQFAKGVGSLATHTGFRSIVWDNELPGWNGRTGKHPTDGEENHDLLLPDFSWEYLPA
ncbi:hypothetical protein ACFY04_43345 [Streptomyces sp. NPDC001549]|uniref:hypothetical protein n=1 Tax=Streptomyces sp. NPDC001549 TaxID=3364586 RepID=UPI0036AF95D4